MIPWSPPPGLLHLLKSEDLSSPRSGKPSTPCSKQMLSDFLYATPYLFVQPSIVAVHGGDCPPISNAMHNAIRNMLRTSHVKPIEVLPIASTLLQAVPLVTEPALSKDRLISARLNSVWRFRELLQCLL